MPPPLTPLQIQPLPPDQRKSTQLGAEVILPDSLPFFDPFSLSEAEKTTFKQAFFEHGILVIRNQSRLQPSVLNAIADLLDPTHFPYHPGGQKQVTDAENILSQNNCSRIPRAPQVTVIGSGTLRDYEEIDELNLKHLDQFSFHENPFSKVEVADGFTRPYRWHMDAALYETYPGVVTSLHAITVPSIPTQKLQFPADKSDDEEGPGSDTTMDVAAGTTLFFSGARNFNLLTPLEQDFALRTTVH